MYYMYICVYAIVGNNENLQYGWFNGKNKLSQNSNDKKSRGKA